MKLKIKHNKIQYKTERIRKKTYQETDWTTHLLLIKSAFYLYMLEMNIIMNQCQNYCRDNHLR